MRVLSVNIGIPKEIPWQSKMVTTGIFKKEVNEPIFLDIEDVKDDHVMDRKNHAGADKAVYAYAKEHYDYFKKLYPTITFYNGIFGENLTVAGLLETEIHIGDVFQIGEAIIQVSQPRIPCYKLGIVFNNQQVIKQFLNTTYCGFYFRILKKGFVKKEDEIILLEKATNSLSVADVFSIYTTNKHNRTLINKIIKLPFLAKNSKKRIQKRLKLIENV